MRCVKGENLACFFGFYTNWSLNFVFTWLMIRTGFICTQSIIDFYILFWKYETWTSDDRISLFLPIFIVVPCLFQENILVLTAHWDFLIEMERGFILLVVGLMVYTAPNVQGAHHLSFSNATVGFLCKSILEIYDWSLQLTFSNSTA